MNGGVRIQRGGAAIAQVGKARSTRERWLRIKRGFHKKEVVVWRGFTVGIRNATVFNLPKSSGKRKACQTVRLDTFSGHLEHYFSDVVAFLQQPVCLSRLGEGELRKDDRTYPAGLQMR